jgi:hypothetical protein
VTAKRRRRKLRTARSPRLAGELLVAEGFEAAAVHRELPQAAAGTVVRPAAFKP